ncbi:MAG TPA: Ig domain-containing protein [Mycobacteriales bacterium]|nr:Ig domain-containing protein [Mycobacteriales bacterium]
MRSRRFGVALAIGALLAAAGLPAAFLPSSAAAAAATTWSAVNPIDHGAPLSAGEPITALACPSASLCVAVGYGDIETTTDPGAQHGTAAGWQVVDVDGNYPTKPNDPTLNAISCPSSTLCVAVDSNGNVASSVTPAKGIAAWSLSSADRGVDLTAVSCPSSGLCVAIGRGTTGLVTLISTDPGKGAKATWTPHSVSAFGSSDGPGSLACPTTTLCVAAGENDSGISAVWTATDPKSTSWTAHQVGSTVGTDFIAVSCGGTSACAAVGEHGQAALSSDASSGASATWHDTTLASDDAVGVSCPTTSLCDATDLLGNVFTSTNPSTSSPTWVEKTAVEGATQTIACTPSASLCVVTGAGSKADSTTDPADGNTATWTTTGYTASSDIEGISCPSSSFCAAADDAGNISTSTDPGSKSATWRSTNVDSGIAINPGGSYFLEGISCPSTSLCVAVDDVGNVLTSTDPGSGSPTWKAAKVDNAGGFTAITCRSTKLCVAVDFAGDAVVSTNPTGGIGAWTTTPIDNDLLVHYASVSCPSATLCFAGQEGGAVTTVHLNSAGAVGATSTADIDLGINWLNGISCPTTTLCVAVDSAGNVEESTKPTGAASTWKRVKIDIVGAANPANDLTAVSCSSSTHCVAVDAAGNAVSTSAPKGAASGWKRAHADPFSGLDAVSCPTSSLCVAGDDTGNEIFGHTGPAGLAISTAKLPSATAGKKYDAKLSASGGTGPYHWKKSSGSLPKGLKLSSKGTISGKPHAAGTSTFVVKVTDSAKTAASVSRTYRLTVHLAIHPTSLRKANVGTAYHVKLGASGGKKPYRWKKTAGSLPAGLKLSAKGTISGKPTAAGTSTFTVKVTDSAKHANDATRRYKLVVG